MAYFSNGTEGSVLKWRGACYGRTIQYADSAEDILNIFAN
jgi:hypothetical protein